MTVPEVSWSPTSCNDNNACTFDSMTGSRANCTTACAHTTITTCVSGDGCCPTEYSDTDSDCTPPRRISPLAARGSGVTSAALSRSTAVRRLNIGAAPLTDVIGLRRLAFLGESTFRDSRLGNPECRTRPMTNR